MDPCATFTDGLSPLTPPLFRVVVSRLGDCKQLRVHQHHEWSCANVLCSQGVGRLSKGEEISHPYSHAVLTIQASPLPQSRYFLSEFNVSKASVKPLNPHLCPLSHLYYPDRLFIRWWSCQCRSHHPVW